MRILTLCPDGRSGAEQAFLGGSARRSRPATSLPLDCGIVTAMDSPTVRAQDLGRRPGPRARQCTLKTRSIPGLASRYRTFN
jgi:hypothetical protein